MLCQNYPEMLSTDRSVAALNLQLRPALPSMARIAPKGVANRWLKLQEIYTNKFAL